MEVEIPFPATGTVTATESGYTANLPFYSEYATETESGVDYLQQAADEVRRLYGTGTAVEVRFEPNSAGTSCGGITVIGPQEDTDN